MRTSILDEFCARPEVAKVLGMGRVRSVLYQSRHLVLDEDASAIVIDMVEKHASLISELREFAKPPFDRMTISLHVNTSLVRNGEILFLIDGAEFATMLRDINDQAQVRAAPGWYLSVEDDPGKSRLVIRTDKAFDDNQDAYYRKQMGIYSLARDAIYLFLNQKRGVDISEPTGARRGMSRGKVVNYFARSQVTLKLNSPDLLRRHYETADRATPRRHEVRGHFAHRGGDLGCTHEWVKDTERERDLWECASCGRRRYWRKSFERGDAGKGFVEQTWKVTV